MARIHQPEAAAPASGDTLRNLIADAGEAGVINLTHALVREALLSGASDIHVEPRRDRGIVRFRIDGVLQERVTLPPSLFASIVSRLKLMANLNVTERRLPQTGHIGILCEGTDYDLHTATMPVLGGESIVMRIVEASAATAWTWESIGFDAAGAMQALLDREHGLVLFAGPPGSGRTRPLYAALNALDAERQNIVVIEDEFTPWLTGIGATRAGLAVAEAVPALMERDVDVIAIGELRDREEVAVALEAASTEHLVLAGLDARDAVHAVERLVALGASPTALSVGLLGVVGACLARRTCPDCREASQPSAEERAALAITPEQASAATFVRGAGCDTCRGTGCRGRVGLYELWSLDSAAARLLAEGAAPERLRAHLAERDFCSLRDVAAQKVREGAITPQEALRVLPS